MKSIVHAVNFVIIFALLATLPLAAAAQAQPDLPKDGDDRPILGELPRFPLEQYYLNPPGVDEK